MTGVLHGGYGYTQWHPILDPDTEPLIIDDPGRCRLPDFGEQLDDVTLTIDLTTWSDRRTEVRCASIP